MSKFKIQWSWVAVTVVALGVLGIISWVIFTLAAGNTKEELSQTKEDTATLEGQSGTNADKILVLCAKNNKTARDLRNAGLCDDSVRIKELIGPTGPAGAQGPVGPRGPIGPSGRDGRDGRNGTNGSDGRDGREGSVGSEGLQGPAGANGVDGTQGPQGEPGPAGPQGEPGTTNCREGYHWESTMINDREAEACFKDETEEGG